MCTALVALATLALIAPAGARAIDLADTRLVADPATSGTRVGFAYANDLWVAEASGSGVRRLTSHPDVEVEQTPAEVIAGKDPQLEKAIEMVLAELAKAPPAVPKRPPFPLRARP